MRIIITVLALLLSLPVYGLSFKAKMSYVKIQTGPAEYTYMEISKLIVAVDATDNTAYVGYHKASSEPNKNGIYDLVFVTLKVFKFVTPKKLQAWIESVRPYNQCLTADGLVDCE